MTKSMTLILRCCHFVVHLKIFYSMDYCVLYNKPQFTVEALHFSWKRRSYSHDSNGFTYFNWMSELLKRQNIVKLTAPLTMTLQNAIDSHKSITPGGRGRLVLRCCLNKSIITVLFTVLRNDKALLKEAYDEISIIGDDILCEIFLSLLSPLDAQVKFGLDTRNASFLDETWELPWFRRYEMVPCVKLGVELALAGGRLIVLYVEPGSLADEDMKIEAGDIVDDLFGESLRRGSIRKAINLMQDYAGSPLYVSVVKCVGEDHQIYRPLHVYLQEVGLCKQALITTRLRKFEEIDAQHDIIPNPTKSLNKVVKSAQSLSLDEETTESGLYRAYFCGFVHVGSTGTVDQIEQGVLRVLKCLQPKRQVLIELGETDVTVYTDNCQSVMLQHGYPEIASCGRRVDRPLNFSYIAGETSCTLSSRFNCFVFEALSDDQSQTILKGVADGFKRTHWTV